MKNIKKDVKNGCKNYIINCRSINIAAVVLIYNARKIVRERFSFGDQNSGTLAVKTIGMVLFCVGMLIIFFNLT